MNAIRWILMIPVLIIAMMIGSLTGGVVCGIFGNQLATDTASAFFGMFTLIITAGFIAPTKRRGTTLVFLILISLLGLFQIIVSVATGFQVLSDLTPVRQILIPAGQILGALLAKLVVSQISPKAEENKSDY